MDMGGETECTARDEVIKAGMHVCMLHTRIYRPSFRRDTQHTHPKHTCASLKQNHLDELEEGPPFPRAPAAARTEAT